MVTIKYPLFALGFVFLTGLTSGRAAADDEIPRGLLAEYTASGKTVRRVDADLSFVWGRATPDQRLAAGPFHAAWTGQILIRAETVYTFHAYLQGDLQVSIDGAPVLAARSDEPGWVSGNPVELSFGFNELTVEYERANAAGRLQLFWSSEQFPLEPLPGHLLFRLDEDENAPSDADLAMFDQGRQLFDAYRCQRCHQPADGAALPPAPALTHVATGTNPQWLLDKLQHRHAEAAGSKMPVYGFTEDDARALLSFLMSTSRAADLLSPPTVREKKDNPLPDGEVLLYSTGCLACHRIGEYGNPGPFGGGDLTTVGSRRSREWLYTKLADQSRLGPAHQMPVFDLRDEERVQIINALVGLSDADAESRAVRFEPDDALVQAGRQLFIDARCDACHEVAGLERPDLSLPGLKGDGDDWSKTCLSQEPDRASLRPAYPQADLEALRHYVRAMAGTETSLADQGDFEQGRRVLERRNCLSCHERDMQTGIVATAGKVAAGDSRLSGQSEALIPPSLTAVGDKMLDEALAEAVSGAQKKRRMPWLSVRMPQFDHSAADKQALLAYLIEHDRIPDGTPDARNDVPPTDAADEQTLLAGQNLVGAGGFSCIACHEFGDYVPPNVAIATHGCDLLGLSSRLRPEYFVRWTRSPLRIVPGMEMPSYERPVPGILEADVHRQLSAIWQALNDPRFTTPTNPTAVEQLLIVNPGEHPRIVRDVFIVPEENGGGYVPRSLTVGFANGHSLLLDLDSLSVRGWTIGEFALQETQGKSWFWKLAGAPVATGLLDGAGIRQRHDWDEDLIAPIEVKLRSYAVAQDSVRLKYTLHFADKPDLKVIDVEELWSPVSRGHVSGVRRKVTVYGSVDSGLLLTVPPVETRLGQARIECGPSNSPLDNIGEGWRGMGFPEPSGDEASSLTVDYLADVSYVPAQPIPAPEVEREYQPVTTVPGYEGIRLQLPESIMPTSLAWRSDGTLAFTSLKGHVYLAHDTDGDGIEDTLSAFEEGLAAPFGVLVDGDDLLVAHKAELLRLRDNDGDGRCDERIVEADGWGYTHDYHDWVTGPVRDASGNLYVATGSDYAHRDRPASQQRWRGKVLRINTAGEIEVFAHELRYPVGIAIDGHDRLFVSDQQGVANTFNEIDHIVAGGRYGVKSQADPRDVTESLPPAVQIPHPWTRSVNGIFFLPEPLREGPFAAFAGQGVGCEYNGRFLVRFSLQEVDGQVQGAAYGLTDTTWDEESDTFLGPICGAVSPTGDIYVGSIHDSGWLGGRNTGEIVRLRPDPEATARNGIREVRAVPAGFEIEFISAVERAAASETDNYSVSGYTRVWEGAYATPDSSRYTPAIGSAQVSDNGRTVTLAIDDLREGFVYEISCGPVPSPDGTRLSPDTAHYTMNRVPR